MESAPINPARKPVATPTGVRPAAGGGGNSTLPSSSQVNTEDTVTLSKQSQRALSKTETNDQKRQLSITDGNDVVMQIVDTKTREVVKQIPSEDELQLKDAIRSIVEDIGEHNPSA